MTKGSMFLEKKVNETQVSNIVFSHLNSQLKVNLAYRIVEGKNVCSCGLPIIFFYPTSGYDMANEMLLYYKCICYFASIWNLLLQLKTKMINRSPQLMNIPQTKVINSVFFSIWHTICESQQNQENSIVTDSLYYTELLPTACKAIALKWRQSVSWGTSLSFFVLADKMRYFCFQSVSFKQSINQSIKQAIIQSIINQYFSFIHTTNYELCTE